jgi:hypothetical protein
VLNARGTWGAVKTALNQAVASGLLGERMFGFAQLELASECISQLMQEYVEKIDPDSSFTVTAFNSHVASMVTQSAQIEGGEKLQPKRLVMIPYRQVMVSYMVNSTMEEARTRLQSRVKEAAVALKEVSPVLCENDIAEPARRLMKDPCRNDPCPETMLEKICSFDPVGLHGFQRLCRRAFEPAQPSRFRTLTFSSM